jgi:polysaccharide export outer membrane protein
VSSLLALAGGSGYLKFFVDLDVALILRKDESLVDIKVIPFSLEAALENPGSELDPILKPLDEVLILDLVTGEGSNRSELLADVNAKLRNEATAAREAEIITIQGKVRMPGDYPILASGELNYLIDLAGGFAEGAYVDQAEVSRRFITADKKEKIELLEVDLASVSDMGSFQLKPRDIVRVNTIPGWQQEQNVTLSGEVVFPGIYAIENGETLASVLNRAGGLTDQAFPEAAIFINQVAKEQQLTQAETIVQRLESELATDAAIEEEGEGDATTDASGLKKSVLAAIDGRIVIDIKSILKGSKKANIELQDGDSLHIPRLNRTVSVAGEVFHPGTFLIDEGSSKSDFIALAGQETRYADKKRTYVIKADGSVTPARGGGMWLSGFSRKGGIEAGDTIVVPTNLDYEQPLNRINAVTSIVFQSMASIAAFFNMSN